MPVSAPVQELGRDCAALHEPCQTLTGKPPRSSAGATFAFELGEHDMEQSIPVFVSPEARIEPVTARRILIEHADEVDGLSVVDDESERGIDPTIAVALISGLSSTIAAAI